MEEVIDLVFEDSDDDEEEHRIFSDIRRGDLEAVKQRVLADATLLEVQSNRKHRTPLMWAIDCKQPAIALWLIQHRGEHDLNTADRYGETALQHAAAFGQLEVMQALVAAGANAAALDNMGCAPLMIASTYGCTDVAAFLLQLPAVKASIDHMSQDQWTALSCASATGRQPIVQLLLDAGANPTVPAGPDSPLHKAYSNNRYAVATLLHHAVAEPDRVRDCVSAMGTDEELGEDLAWEISTFLLPAWAITKRRKAGPTMAQRLAARAADVGRLEGERGVLEEEKRLLLNKTRALARKTWALEEKKRGLERALGGARATMLQQQLLPARDARVGRLMRYINALVAVIVALVAVLLTQLFVA